MSRLVATLLLAFALAVTPLPVAHAEPALLTLRDIDGRAFLVANDGTYLGKLSSNAFDSESVCNDFGPYGNPFSSTSIRNKFGPYGNPFSHQSAYNEFTASPPAIVHERSMVGYITKNKALHGAVDPDVMFGVYGCAD